VCETYIVELGSDSLLWGL